MKKKQDKPAVMSTLKNKTIFITGASRGIGKAIGLRAAKDGANVVVIGKTVKPHSKLPGTIFTAAEEIEKAGGVALALKCDIRLEEEVEKAVEETIKKFGGIDVLINNASAINLTGTSDTPMRRFDLMFSVNVRGTFLCSQKCLPHLKKSDNPHILNLAPPLNMDAKWFSPHVAYTMSKYGMSECVLGMAEEFKSYGVAVNALWPRTTIATAAVNMLGGDVMLQHSRKPEIMADAAHAILMRDSKQHTGHFYIDDEVLTSEGVTDLEAYSVQPGNELQPDFFL